METGESRGTFQEEGAQMKIQGVVNGTVVFEGKMVHGMGVGELVADNEAGE